ncbi:hypothetical protein DGo_CA1987 [Deinococcus gobiensis I-0]|uniref:Uncharacterized protein n=1 Tax=Deinococcus gobiensis (strain DSM 21396 / JCM 16679 / CGMCC 1.7299 / I-0) TaxID=745776 RepID=H8GXR2_DEIGI|nr:hypothetical protein DGo_CA1987 [Deinococcus gobiensis I-0]
MGFDKSHLLNQLLSTLLAEAEHSTFRNSARRKVDRDPQSD